MNYEHIKDMYNRWHKLSSAIPGSPLVMLLKVIQLQYPKPVREVDLTDVLRRTHSDRSTQLVLWVQSGWWLVTYKHTVC